MALTVRIHKQLHTFALHADFTVEAGVTALLGASGSGKSMTLKCIAGIETPDSGYIELDGRVLYDSERRIDLAPQKRRIGYLFQSYALFPTMTVAQNIAAGVHKGRAERKRAVREKLEAFYLTELADKLPAELSGGQQQRVALARILASEPTAILLDEPFSALDSFLKWQLEQELHDTLAAFPGVTLFVSHDRDEVYRNCPRVIVVDEGVCEPTCDLHALFEAPGTLCAARLSGCKNFTRAALTKQGVLAVPAWNLSLCCRGATEGITHIGIRSHSLRPAAAGDGNRIPCRIVRRTEEPFAFVLMLAVDGAASDAPPLRVELSKAAYAALPAGDALTVTVDPADILLLTDRPRAPRT